MKFSNATQALEDRARDELAAADRQRAALAHVTEAFAEALLEGIEPDCFAHAALHAGLQHLVDAFGEEAVARLAEELPGQVRAGMFSVPLWH